MDRALNLSVLAGALDDTANLPSPDELRSMLANAEVAAFFHQTEEIDHRLLVTAWNLHHVGTARPQLQLYETSRQVQANSVAAHVFDLALQGETISINERLVLTFAAQVSSIRGDRTPNASALGRRLPAPSARLEREPGKASLELGCAFLTLDRSGTVGLLRERSRQLQAVSTSTDALDGSSGLASAIGVVDGVRKLQRYLTYGAQGDLEEARQILVAAATSEAARRDLDSRWVAAHLVDLCDDLGGSSVWSILPEGTPPGVGQAMTLGDPPVMTLWPPQVSLLANSATSPLQAAVRRAVLTFPTSAGKTLLSQLLIAQHLAVVGTGVCFVAPSHSLCREVRDGLDRRLWALRKFVAEDGPLGDPGRAHAPVVVMTPERLAARLRSDEQTLLDDFGLFVLDEAHLIDDEARGWTFETTISRLHALTKHTHHRIFLISAALGGTASVQTWLDMDGGGSATTSTWRGPRRLHATYTPTPDDSTIVTIPPQGRQRLPRTVTELKGVIRLYVDEGEAIATRSTPLGHVTVAGKTTKKPSRSEQIAPVVHLAARAGPVLTVHATKIAAERLAGELAAQRGERSGTGTIVRLAEQRLGAGHPLVAVLRSGVAYHHAALPKDVQAEIEGAARSGVLQIVCSTTTLTEGINLPVRTVIVCERGYYDGTEFREQIDGADLMNAAGRAGRAGRETEGWVVINHEYGATSPRQALRELDAQQDIRSTLNVETALSELAEYEQLIHATAGIVLTDVPPTVDGFLAFCWYLADAADVLDPDDRRVQVLEGIRHTLAWQQLPVAIRARWEALADRVAASFELTDPVQRRRWARSGARLSANAVLESVAQGAAIATVAMTEEQRADPIQVLLAVVGDGRLLELLGLANERDYRFKRKRYGPTELVAVDLEALVLDWVRGVALAELASKHLSAVDAGDDDGYRFEQLSTFLTRICEHHLPFTLGTILEWIDSDLEDELCPALPAYVHYGVENWAALELLTRGVRSRRLAVVVGQRASAAGVAVGDLREWLAGLGAPTWRTEFLAGAAEVGDLLQFLHDPTAAVGGSLLDGESVEMDVDPGPGEWATADELPIVRAVTDEDPSPLVLVNSAGEIVCTIRAAEYRHLAVLIDAGFQLLASRAAEGDHVIRVAVRADLD